MNLKAYRQEVFNILSQCTYTDNIQWLGQKEDNGFPLILYSRFDLEAKYSFGLNRERLSYYTEVRVYTEDIDLIDDIMDEISDLFLDYGYMIQTAPNEFSDDETGVNVSIIRFYKV